MRWNLRRFSTAVVGLVVTGGVALLSGGSATAAPAVHPYESNGGVKIMPLGDSITDGYNVPGGYRINLWQRLAAGGYTVDFVGSGFNGPANLGDHDHEGHPGWRIDQIDANIVGWLRTYTPRTVLLHIGTNDVLQNFNLSGAPGRLSTLVDHITATAPNAEVFVATIIPLANSGQEANARTFNATIPGMVASKANAGKHVHLVDMHSALTTGDLIDGIHPTANGYDKMAATWYSALLTVPGSISPVSSPSPSNSPSRSVSPSVSPSATSASPSVTPSNGTSPSVPSGTGGCTAAYAVTGSWTGGFQAEVTVTAGGRALAGWTVTWTYPSGQSVSQFWS